MGISTRPLGKADLDRVVAIDRATTGQSRRQFFEKRLASGEKRPSDVIQIGVVEGDALHGFAIAHILRGEFGRRHVAVVLDSLGVAQESRGHGVGQALMQAVVAAARQCGAKSVQSQVAWANSDLLRFFNAAKFTLSPSLGLERPAGSLAEQAEQEP